MKNSATKLLFVLLLALVASCFVIYNFVIKASSNSIESFCINKSSNENALLEDYSAVIENDSVKIFVPYLVNFDLVADFDVAYNTKVYCDDVEIKSGLSVVNYLKPRQFKVVARNGDIHIYTVCIYNSGLPVIYLTTFNNQTINSKKTWFKDTQFTVYKADGTVDYDSDVVKVRGRGNSTWSETNRIMKLPYSVKLNEDASILGMLEHNRWVLLANFYDLTFFRNEVSSFIGKRFTNQNWVPSGYNIELVLNGSHRGNYYFCEQPKVHKNRVDGKFLIEADIKRFIMDDMKEGAIEGPKSHNAFYIKSPKVKKKSDDYQNVKNIIEQFETALYSGDYNTLEKLIDLESFVDWFMIKEWSHDIDGNMHTSSFFSITDDNKIKMGPLWDFDSAWGNNPFSRIEFDNRADADYYAITNPLTQLLDETCTSWFSEFIKMPAFQKMLKEKVLNVNSHMDEILAYIDENTENLVLSATANKEGFGLERGRGAQLKEFLGVGSVPKISSERYCKNMKDLKTFIEARMVWFVKEVNSF